MLARPAPQSHLLMAATAFLALAAPALPAYAHPGGPGPGFPRWGGIDDGRPRSAEPSRRFESRQDEGRVHVSSFVAEGEDAARQLGHGAIVVASGTAGDEFVAAGSRAPYEAAVVDCLVRAGYDTASTTPEGGQVVELRVTRRLVQEAETARKPVSGSAAMEVSNRGTAYGMAINVDLTKPRPALVSTRLEARIRDRATSQVLWEGQADVNSREGAEGWSNQDIAGKLAAALFDRFPAVDRTASIFIPGTGNGSRPL